MPDFHRPTWCVVATPRVYPSTSGVLVGSSTSVMSPSLVTESTPCLRKVHWPETPNGGDVSVGRARHTEGGDSGGNDERGAPSTATNAIHPGRPEHVLTRGTGIVVAAVREAEIDGDWCSFLEKTPDMRVPAAAAIAHDVSNDRRCTEFLYWVSSRTMPQCNHLSRRRHELGSTPMNTQDRAGWQEADGRQSEPPTGRYHPGTDDSSERSP